MAEFADPNIDTNAQRVVLAAGSADAPSLTWANDLSKGFYYDSLTDEIVAVGFSGGGGGITELTGDIIAGPGSGSQVATISYPLNLDTGFITPANPPLTVTGAGSGGGIYGDNGQIRFSHNSLFRMGIGDSRLQLGAGVGLYLMEDDSTVNSFISYDSGTLQLTIHNNGGTTQIDAGGAPSAVFDGSTNPNETRFLVFDVTAATLQRVTIGAADSGGTGFRVLRIPN